MSSVHPLPELRRRIAIATLFLLPDCDMACPFCAAERRFDVMSAADARRVLVGLHEQGVRNVVLGGGEPFLWPGGLLELAAFARRLGFLVQVSTNGRGLPCRFEACTDVDRFVLPLEAADAGLHDRLRPARGGHHQIVLQRLSALQRAGREVTVATVATRENLHALPDLARFLRRLVADGLRLHAWHLYRFIAVGRGGERTSARFAISRDEYFEACRRVRSLGVGAPIFRRDDMRRPTTIEYLWYEDRRLRIGSDTFTASGAA